MEVFKAVSEFSAPKSEGSLNLLSFNKGDLFEVLDKTKSDWWGARRLNDNIIGYVPSKYLQYEERRIGTLLPDSYHEHRESQLKRFAAMQNSDQHKHPVSIYGEFGVPVDFDLPMDTAVPTDFGVGGLGFGGAQTGFSTEGFGEPAGIGTDYCGDVMNGAGTDYLPPPSEELYPEVPEPDPDYQDEDSSDFPPPPPPIAGDDMLQTSSTDTSTASPTVIGIHNGAVSSPEDEGDLIQPKKLVNPCVVSKERQALHRELLLNYKLGKDVLQKPELNKILAKRKETQKRKEWEEQQASKRTSLELRLEQQANKLKEKESEKMKAISEDDKAPEFVQMHRRITHKTPTSPPT